MGLPDTRSNAQSYHFNAVAVTEDHTLAHRDEFDRIVDWGGDVRRLVNDNTYRMFLKDRDVPGLTLTRAIGDRVAHSIGVDHMPSFSVLARAEIPPGAFLLLGTGGIWATMSERAAVNYVSRYFDDPDEAASGLVAEAERRWRCPSSRARKTLGHDEPDAFTALLLYADRGQDPGTGTRALESSGTMTARSFAIGAHHQPDFKKPWHEVKGMDRLGELRQAQKERGRGRGEDGAAEFRENLAPRAISA